MTHPQSVIKNCFVCSNAEQTFYTNKNSHNIYKCLGCGLLSVIPLPESTKSIYDDDYFSSAKKGFGYPDYDRDKEPMRHVFINSLKLAEQKLGRIGKLLDIGAATGFFMEEAKKRGWEVRGIEISEYAGKKAVEKGLEVSCGTIEDGFYQNEKFDLVTLWDVLEHVPDPTRLMNEVVSRLEPHGMVFINTPNSSSIVARILRHKWHLILPPEHLHLFSQANLTGLLVNSNLRILDVSTMAKKFNLSYLINFFAEWSRFPFGKRIFEITKRTKIAQRIYIPLNLRDNMFVIAQKY